MSNFTPLVKREFDFQGDKVQVTYSRLKRIDMLKVLPIMQEMKEGEDPDQKAIHEILELLIDQLPDYITSFTGLLDAEGQSVEVDKVISEFYFLQLAAEIAVQMIRDSSATGGNA